MQFAEEDGVPALKPQLIRGTYAALKGRSFTVPHASTSVPASAANSGRLDSRGQLSLGYTPTLCPYAKEVDESYFVCATASRSPTYWRHIA
jgi:hypothetical protein